MIQIMIPAAPTLLGHHRRISAILTSAFIASEHPEKGAKISECDESTWVVDTVTKGEFRFLDDGSLEWQNTKTRQWCKSHVSTSEDE